MIELDAARHHLHVLVLQACTGAVLAFHGTIVAGLDAVLVFLVHDPPSF
jgi:hypothetical protein